VIVVPSLQLNLFEGVGVDWVGDVRQRVYGWKGNEEIRGWRTVLRRGSRKI